MSTNSPTRLPPQPLNTVFLIAVLVVMIPALVIVFMLALGIMVLRFPDENTPRIRVPQGPIFVDPTAPVGAEKDVEKVVLDQAAAWNKGDIDGFMAGYSKKRLLYTSGDKKITSFDALKKHYTDRYPGKEGMGTLEFGDLKVELIDSVHAAVDGTWKVTAKGETKSGGFSLILSKEEPGWRVIVDHTTSAPKS